MSLRAFLPRPEGRGLTRILINRWQARFSNETSVESPLPIIGNTDPLVATILLVIGFRHLGSF